MAKQANRMMIGGFVVVAVILLAASLVVFGSGRFFRKTSELVLYFDGSIRGLNVGAPVLFQGVQIGSVKSISLRASSRGSRVVIPVIIEIEPEKFVSETGHPETREDNRKILANLIDKGLRAVLTTQSFITGQLMIEIDFHPGTPIELKHTAKDLPEIPTIPSTTARLVQTLQKLDLEGMQGSLEKTLSGIDRLVNNPDLNAGIGELKGVLSDARRLVQNMNTRVDPLADGVEAAVHDTRKLVKNLDGRLKPLADSVNRAAEGFDKLARDADARLGSLAESFDRTMAEASGVLSEDASLIVELEATLREISAAARSIRQLADLLERHPEALIRGKGGSGGK
ncbi:MAG: MlaD family protein [Deltaproteobacteria bacterium]|nr:MlaD family protein [Deltaproteobacteria bacterium]